MTTATQATITGIDVHAYLVKDPARAIAFYRDTLGLTPSWEHPQGAEFELADGSTFGVWKMDDGSWHPSAGVMFSVPDVRQAAEQFSARGLKVLEGPFETKAVLWQFAGIPKATRSCCTSARYSQIRSNDAYRQPPAPTGRGSARFEQGAMKIRDAFIMAAFLAFAAAFSSASNAAAPKAPPNTPTAEEMPFVTKATADLNAAYGTTSGAAKAGYFRYNNEDNTGAISWVNTKYWTSDEMHPSQLWYDVKGRLIGVDYSLPYTDAKHPPSMWGILPARWFLFGSHVHYILRQPNGSLKYGLYLEDKVVKAHGGDPAHPTAADVVKAGKAKSASQVATTFAFPDLWDLEFWLVPNPSGAFAVKNPNVKPSANAEKGM